MHLLFHPFCTVILHFHNVSAFSWLYCCFHLRLSSTLLGSRGWWALGALFCRRGMEAGQLRALPMLGWEWKSPDSKFNALTGWVLEGSTYTKLEVELPPSWGFIVCAQLLWSLLGFSLGSFPEKTLCSVLHFSAHFTCSLVMLCF